MGLQCNLKIRRGGSQDTCQLKLYKEDCLLELTDDQIVNIPEYRPFDIIVNADISDEGHFELPELIDYEIQSRDDYISTVTPEYYEFNHKYCIYANSWENQKNSVDLQTVPLTPGYYTIRISLNTDQIFFAYWYITPKELKVPEWKIMRDDVENMVKGLALDYSRQMRTNVRSTDERNTSKSLDDDIAFLLRQEKRIRYAVETLRNEAKYQINKSYSWIPAGVKNEIDQQTIRKIGERPDKRGSLYIPKRYLEYDVPANQWLKLFLKRLSKFCEEKIAYTKQVELVTKKEYESQYKYLNHWSQSEKQYTKKDYANSISELNETINTLKKLREYLHVVLEDTFLKSVSMPNNTALPKALMLNASYNVLYKVYMTLFQKNEHFMLDRSYRRYWKKTAQLYEIWTFVRVLASLIRQGFEPTSGWIYDSQKGNRVLPFLTEGTQISFSSNSLIVNLTYNETIPYYEKDTSYNKPLQTFSDRNKPDIRIDVFDLKKRYLGSILLDAKYIKLSNILNRLRPSERGGLRDQFTSYVNDPNSPFYDNYQFMKYMRPVAALLVLYPTGDIQKNVKESKNTGKNVRYIQTRPGADEMELDNTISENIEEIQERSQMFKESGL